MKLFECSDDDCGGRLYIVAEDVRQALSLFEADAGYLPRRVWQLSDRVLVQKKEGGG